MARKRRSRRSRNNKSKFDWIIAVRGMVALVILMPVLGILATRSIVLKPLLLPRLSQATNLQWQCDSLSYSPWRGFTMNNAKASASGFSLPVLEFSKASINSPGFAIFKKSIIISHLSLENPVIRLVAPHDSQPSWAGFKESYAYKKPVQNNASDMVLEDIKISHAELLYSRERSDGSWTRKSLSNINVQCQDWAPGKSFTLSGDGKIRYESTTKLEESGGQLTSSISIKTQMDINRRGNIQGFNIEAHLEPIQATGIYMGSDGLDYKLMARHEKELLSPATLSVSRNHNPILTMNSFGRLDLVKKEANQNIEVSGELSALNPLLPAEWVSISSGQLSGNGSVYISQFGNTQVYRNEFVSTDLVIQYRGNTLQKFSTDLALNLTRDDIQKSVRIDGLEINMVADDRNYFKAINDKPINFSLGTFEAGFAESSCQLEFRAELNRWEPLILPNLINGNLSGSLIASFKKDGRHIEWDGSATVDGVQIKSFTGDHITDPCKIEIVTSGPWKDFKSIENAILQFQLRQNDKLLGTAKFDYLLLEKNLGSNVISEFNINDLAFASHLYSIPYVSDLSGKAYVSFNHTQTDSVLSKLTASLLSENISGTFFGYPVMNMRNEAGFRLDYSKNGFNLEKAALDIRLGLRTAFSANGRFQNNYLDGSQSGEFVIFDFNQEFLRIIQPEWLKQLEINEFNLGGKFGVAYNKIERKYSIHPEIEVSTIQPRGLSRSFTDTLPFSLSGTLELEGNNLLIDQMDINISPRLKGSNNHLTLADNNPIRLKVIPAIQPVESSIAVNLESENLALENWSELLEFWIQKQRQITRPTSPPFTTPVQIKLNARKMSNKSESVQNWKKEIVISHESEIAEKIRSLIP